MQDPSARQLQLYYVLKINEVINQCDSSASQLKIIHAQPPYHRMYLQKYSFQSCTPDSAITVICSSYSCDYRALKKSSTVLFPYNVLLVICLKIDLLGIH